MIFQIPVMERRKRLFCFVFFCFGHIPDGLGEVGQEIPSSCPLTTFLLHPERHQLGTCPPFSKFVNPKNKAKTETFNTLLFHFPSTLYPYFPYLHRELNVKNYKSSWVNCLITFSGVHNVKLPGTSVNLYFPEM